MNKITIFTGIALVILAGLILYIFYFVYENQQKMAGDIGENDSIQKVKAESTAIQFPDNVSSNVDSHGPTITSPQGTRYGAGASRSSGAANIGDLVEGVVPYSGDTFFRPPDTLLHGEMVSLEGDTMISARSHSEITREMSEKNIAVEFCAKKELKIVPTLNGEIEVEFVISPIGRVKAFSISKSSINSERLEKCIFKRIQRFRFTRIDKNAGDVTVRYKYTFKGSSGGQL